MGKSNWKFNFISKSIISTVIKHQLKFRFKRHDIVIMNKNSVVPKQLYRLKLLIYKGSRFRIFKVTNYNIGWKFGEFTFTRKPHIFIKKIKNKKNKNIRR